MDKTNHFSELAAINVSDRIEKKSGMSYLSWPFAVDQLMRADSSANWQFHDPVMYGETMMVSCTVTAFGKPITMHLPVMDHRNQAIKNPDAFQVNKNMMRCLVKAIACHGLGLYIYAGEDLPHDDGQPAYSLDSILSAISTSKTLDILKTHYGAALGVISAADKAAVVSAKDKRKKELTPIEEDVPQ